MTATYPFDRRHKSRRTLILHTLSVWGSATPSRGKDGKVPDPEVPKTQSYSLLPGSVKKPFVSHLDSIASKHWDKISTAVLSLPVVDISGHDEE